MPEPSRLIAALLTFCGGGILVASLIFYRRTVKLVSSLPGAPLPPLNQLYRTLSLLMVFFVFSYLGVCGGLLFTANEIHPIFIGTVFIFGALFVFLAVIVQMKMLESVIIHFETSGRLSDALIDERSRVDEVLNELSSESSRLRESEIEKDAIAERLSRIEQYEVLGQMSGAIAHEINNHLSPIVALPEIVLASLPDDFKHRRLLEQMVTAALATTNIVHNLLSLTNRNPSIHQPLVINDVVDQFFDSKDLTQAQQLHESAQFRWQLATDIREISGSQSSLVQLINNLVSNALESSSPNAVIHISTCNEFVDQPKRLSHDTLLAGDYVVLKVADEGKGMSPEQVDTIFEPFQTGNDKERDELISIGMICARATADDHGAKLNVESELGKGTTVEVYIPIIKTATDDDCPETTQAISKLGQGPESGTRVLVVDDMKTQRELATSLLEHLGCKPDAVPTGEQALQTLQTQPYDLVLLDMRLGDGIDGLTTFEQIKQIAPELHIIIASGYSRNDRVRAAVKQGAAFIKKPYHLERLERVLREYAAQTSPSV